MSKKPKNAKVKIGEDGLSVLKNAGFVAEKRDKTMNKRAGLHDKNKSKNENGVSKVYRRKPLALKHKRRLRKVALAFSAVLATGAAGLFGVGFFKQAEVAPLVDYGYSTVCYELPQNGSAPTSHTALEAVGYMNYRLKQQPNWYSEFHSKVHTIMEQEVTTYKQFCDGVLISSDITRSSLVNNAKQFCTTGDKVLWRNAAGGPETYNGIHTKWSENLAGNLPIEGEGGYKAQRGFPPSEFSVYVINENTLLTEGTSEYVEDNGDGTYSVSLRLNAAYSEADNGESSAVYYYRQQMVVTGGLTALPEFRDINVKYTFDGDWKVLKSEVVESYTAYKGVPADCVADSVTEYSYDSEKSYNTYYKDYFEPLINKDVKPEDEKLTAADCLSVAFGSVINEGAVFKLQGSAGAFPLNGVINVEMSEGGLSALGLKLGDITAHVLQENGESVAYISVGENKFRLNTARLTREVSPDGVSGEDSGSDGALDLDEILKQLGNEDAFFVSEDGKRAVLSPTLELFGLKIPLEFTFGINGKIITLDYVKTELSFGETVLNAKLTFGTKSDAPAALTEAEKAEYTDILNDGLALKVALGIDNLKIDGTVFVGFVNGKFNTVRAKLGALSVIYVNDALFLKSGDNVGYKLRLPIGDASAVSEKVPFDILGLVKAMLGGLVTDENGITVSGEAALFETIFKIAVTVNINNGFGVKAEIEALGKKIAADVCFGDMNDVPEELTDAQLAEFIDLSDGFSVSGSLSFEAGGTEIGLDVSNLALSFESGLNIAMSARLTVGGTYNDIYIRYGNGVLTFAYGEVGLQVDTVDGLDAVSSAIVTCYNKIASLVNEMLGSEAMEQAEKFDDLLNMLKTGQDTASGLNELLKLINIPVGEDGKPDIAAIISKLHIYGEDGDIKLSLGDNIVINLGFKNGFTVNGGLGFELGGKSARLKFDNIKIMAYSEPVFAVENLLTAEDLAEIIDYLTATVQTFTERSFAFTVSGSLADESPDYASSNGIKYNFNAQIEFDAGKDGTPIHIDMGAKEESGLRKGMNFYVDSTVYAHVIFELEAQNAKDDSVYLDLYILDATPSGTQNGKTSGGYYTDDVLDVYLTLSKYAPNTESYNPLKLYAPMDEIMSLLSMGLTMLNLDEVEAGTDKTDEKLTAQVNGVISEIANAVNQLLTEVYLPYTHSQFASLGESLIPQILKGQSLTSVLNGLLEKMTSALNEEDVGENEPVTLKEGNFLKAVSVSEGLLEVTLNSESIYGVTPEENGNIKFAFSKERTETGSRLTGIRLNNLYFGENNANRLGFDIGVSYGNIIKPSGENGFADYKNFDDVDTLLKTFVNSATHPSSNMDEVDKQLYSDTDKKVPDYLLNHNYYISGEVELTLGDYLIPVQVQGLSAHIDADNEVSLNTSLLVKEKKIYIAGMIPVTIVNADTYVDLTVKDGLIYVRRTVNGSAEYRIMTSEAFAADMMNQIKFMFNFGSTVANIIDMATGSGGSGNDFKLTFDDFGDYISKFLTLYSYDNANESWNIVINGETLSGLAGIKLSDVTVALNGAKSSVNEGSVLKSLDIGLQLFGMMNVKGSLNYLNPQYVWVDGKDKTNSTCDLSAVAVSELGGLSWTEILTGKKYSELKAELKNFNENSETQIKKTVFDAVCEHTEWSALIQYLGTADYLRFGDGVNLFAGSVSYIIEREQIGYFSREEFSGRVPVLYYGSEIFTKYLSDIEQIKAIAQSKYSDMHRYEEAVFTGGDGEFAFEYHYKESEFDRVNVTIVSKVAVPGFTFNSQTENYERVLSFINGFIAEFDSLGDINAYIFDGFYETADFAGEKITSTVAEEGLQIYAKWIAKDVVINYISDVEYNGEYTATEEGGNVLYVSHSGGMNYDNVEINGELTAVDATVKFFGWYIELADGSYAFINNSDALRSAVDGMNFKGSGVIEVNLLAVWISTDFTVTTTRVHKESSRWTIDANFGVKFVGEISEVITASTDVSSRFAATVNYKIQGKTIFGSHSDTIGKNSEFNGTFDISKVGMTSASAISWKNVSGAAQVTVKFKGADGNYIILGEKTSEYITSNV